MQARKRPKRHYNLLNCKKLQLGVTGQLAPRARRSWEARIWGTIHSPSGRRDLPLILSLTAEAIRTDQLRANPRASPPPRAEERVCLSVSLDRRSSRLILDG